MLILLETPAGYGLFSVTQKSLLKMAPEDLWTHFETPEAAQKAVSLVAFKKFGDTAEAMAEASALADSEMGKCLKKFLKKNVSSKMGSDLSESLAVEDKALAAAIKTKLEIPVVVNPTTHEIARGIRQHVYDLVHGLTKQDSN
eukprot:GHVU01032800.1.p1 GENE.GHVU01032800.1~~GHVU01032800.1.p1  ORF type:complete len:143 (+),score=41.67 GHVU01032800.1:388-816(+)